MTPTPAQIEAADFRKGIRCPHCDKILYIRLPLTAAAEVGKHGIGVGDMPQLAMIENLRDQLAIEKDKVAATIERCAQVAEDYWDEHAGKDIGRRIRALKDKHD